MILRRIVAISLREMKAERLGRKLCSALAAGAPRCRLARFSGEYCRPRRLHLAERDVHKGLTLVELLVVVVILTTLVAAAIPVMAPSSETRRLREAARSLNTMIATAQTKATELGRPYGVWLQKQSVQTKRAEDRGAVMTVFYCEEPPPFGGFDETAAVILKPNSPLQYRAAFGRFVPPQFALLPLPPALFRPGDRLIHRGTPFEFLGPPDNQVDDNGFLASTDVYVVRRLDLDPSQGLPQGRFLSESYRHQGRLWTHPQGYTIRRQPQKVDDPLQLPAGIAIDLEASGDRSMFFHDPTRPTPVNSDTAIALLFSPGGALHSVYRNEGGDNTPAFGASQLTNDSSHGPIYLMVAKRETVGESQLDPTKVSWLDPESLWVSVSPQTGRVVTEVNSVSEFTTLGQSYADLRQQRLQSREFARKGQGMGGR